MSWPQRAGYSEKAGAEQGGSSHFSGSACFDLLLQSPHGESEGDPHKLDKDYLPDENSSIKLFREMPQPSSEPMALPILLEKPRSGIRGQEKRA